MSGTQVTAPTRAEFRSLKECKTLGEAFNCGEFLDRIKQSAPAHVKPQRMLRTFIQATSRTPDLLKCNIRSVLGAMLTCSEVGLEPNTPLQHAFLIPFARTKWDPVAKRRVDMGHEVQLIFGYPGLLDLAYRSGHVTSVHADVVWAAEAKDEKRFSFSYGTDAHLRHVPMGHHEDNETPMWVYAHANLTNGQAFEVMPWADVMRIRNQSQGFQSALRAKEQGESAQKPYIPRSWTDAPWVKHQVPMAKKTAFRSLWKWLPHSVELAGALALDEQQDRSTIDFGAVIDGSASIMDGGFEDGETIEGEASTATFTDRREPPAVTQQSNPAPVVETRKEAPPAQTPPPPTDNTERDSAGVAWDAARHASSKAKNTDGTWRARRGVEKTATQASDGIPDDRWGDTPPVADSGLFDGEQQAGPGPSQTIPPQSGGFSRYLLDEAGKPMPDGDGVLEPFTDPEAWAEAYVGARDSFFPGDLPGFEAANAEAAREAMAASKEVVAIIGGGAPETRQDEPEGAAIPWPEKPSAADAKIYMAVLKAALDGCSDPDAINRVIDHNAPTYDQFPPKYRLEAKALVQARQQAISPAPARGQETPTIAALADSIIADVASLETLDDLNTWKQFTTAIAEVEKVRREAPDHHARIQAAITKRETDLKVAVVRSEWDRWAPGNILEELIKRINAAPTMNDLVAVNQTASFVSGGEIVKQSEALFAELGAAYRTRKKALGG